MNYACCKHRNSCFHKRRFCAWSHWTLSVQKKIKVHRFTNNLQGLQKAMVKDLSWNIIPWNALLFEKTAKQYKFSLTRITDLFETHVITRRNARKQGWVFLLFSLDSDDRLSLNFHRFVIWYRSCGTQSVGLGQHCLPKGSNGFKVSRAMMLGDALTTLQRLKYCKNCEANWGVPLSKELSIPLKIFFHPNFEFKAK